MCTPSPSMKMPCISRRGTRRARSAKLRSNSAARRLHGEGRAGPSDCRRVVEACQRPTAAVDNAPTHRTYMGKTYFGFLGFMALWIGMAVTACSGGGKTYAPEPTDSGESGGGSSTGGMTGEGNGPGDNTGG